ncbi:MAG: phosphoglucosamine mutase [Clostridiales bacterium]|nr:phosphoglucosamine mutase [Clostridiales bacterium]
MGVFFGTDGIRGLVNEELSVDTAKKIGNALTIIKKRPTVIIGCDTRVSGDLLMLGVALGVVCGGGKVVYIGVCPTAGIAYITKNVGADFGVVISASHNSGEYNGIKIFNSEGYKLSDRQEEQVERLFIRENVCEYPHFGCFKQDFSLIDNYVNYLFDCVDINLDNLKVVIDGAFGASFFIAPLILKRLGCEVVELNCVNNGEKINDKCGAVNVDALVKAVLSNLADVGFAYDGDSDRVIAVAENGEVVDGDRILYILSRIFYEKGLLRGNAVVGTSNTNFAVEDGLKKQGINLIRADIGDKYVLRKMIENDIVLGGEQSGHVIIKDIATTGDGILTSLLLLSAMKGKDVKLSNLYPLKLCPQENVSITVKDKLRIINSEKLSNTLKDINIKIGSLGRVLVRASGTEPKIRIMVESVDKNLNVELSNQIVDVVISMDEES